MEFIKELKSLLFKFNPSNAICYNPMTSSIEWGICDRFQKARIKIAPTLNKEATGRAQKGEKRFDHKNAAIISLSVEECWKLFMAIPLIVKGEFNQKDQNKDNIGKLVLEHYRDGKKSYFVVEPAKKDGQITGTIRLTIIPPKGTGNWASYNLRSLELKRFSSFMENCAKNLEYESSKFDCLRSVLNSSIYSIVNDKSPEQGKFRANSNPTEEYSNQAEMPDEESFPVTNDDSDLPW